MPQPRYLTAKVAAERLEISLQTLYAYVSRGLIRSEAVGDNKRERRYYAEDVEKLLARKEGRRNPEKLAQDALHWGAPVMDSAITLIKGGTLYYRGKNVNDLAHRAQVEEVASLIWTGDSQQASILFSPDNMTSVQKYETMLLHIGIDGADMNTIQEFQTVLPAATADDPTAYDFRPAAVASSGARIMRLMTSIAAGDVPENKPIARMLQIGWAPSDPHAEHLLRAALIVCADHELNASSFAARVVASAGSTPYAAVQAGLATIQGIKHGGYTERVEAFLNEISAPHQARDTFARRLRRGETIPSFGHLLYPDGDPRAQVLLDIIEDYYADTQGYELMQAIISAANDLIGEKPTIDFALVMAARVLGLPDGTALTLFALGRTIGWIGHAIEQYSEDRMIRPRARYTGAQPE